ncbi:hypothetical protein SAMN02746066_03926 [Anaerosporobacter mobilis DSM 15930]|uniref:Pycsar effector protein domain-containing protein n=1 Tax=Anaerosporobacter mobilis DSM 15930 TaxID=1120996 RepID=A0A1M7MNN5_9FIRM|nr:hypothetical protein [Anaerosporobacter mobilis]SHM92612.1 hypothetical protein SAMN02746066_03926 [Anaerosporobacter mobilis DSM 15930]
MKLDKDDLNQILDRNIAWIENCDNKASIMLGAFGVALSVIFALDYATIILNVIQEKWSNPSFGNIAFLILVTLSLCAFLYGGYKLIKTLTPKIDMRNLGADEKMCSNSIIYFSTIAIHSNYTKFLDRLKETNDDNYLNDISSQIYICAKICDLKFKDYKKGLHFSISGLLAFMLLITCGYFI